MLELTPMRPAFLICFLILAGMLLGEGTPPAASTPTAVCTSGVGPGIPPPANVPSGLPGFHAAWYGQSGYPTLCPGERSTATVAYYNSGSFGWVRGRMGEMAFLGTSDPVPGHDQPSQLGGDGQLGSPATGWPRYNRVAAQPADYVGPGQVAWFQFTVQAPTAPGVTAGATAGLQLNVTVTSGDFVDFAGNPWDVNGSEDVTLGTPD